MYDYGARAYCLKFFSENGTYSMRTGYSSYDDACRAADECMLEDDSIVFVSIGYLRPDGSWSNAN